MKNWSCVYKLQNIRLYLGSFQLSSDSESIIGFACLENFNCYQYKIAQRGEKPAALEIIRT